MWSPVRTADTQVRRYENASLRGWMPAIHAGMTESAFSFSTGERTLMKHFVLRSNCFFKIAVATWVKRKIRPRAGAPAAHGRDRLGTRAAREVPYPLGRRSVQGLFIFLVLSVAPL
jgi:hypothetical protein